MTSIKGERGNFADRPRRRRDAHRRTRRARRSGVQGNLRQLAIPGAELPFVQYQLDDPDEYKGEEIIVIGTGDAGIENALALSANNNVSVINRVADFPYAKPANAALIQAAINKGDITAFFNAEPKRVEPGISRARHAGGRGAGQMRPHHRPHRRLAAAQIRRILRHHVPERQPDRLSATSRRPTSSQVPGLYIIGALAGYPLIKQCLNQGYEVVEYILGNTHPAGRRAADPGQARQGQAWR